MKDPKRLELVEKSLEGLSRHFDKLPGVMRLPYYQKQWWLQRYLSLSQLFMQREMNIKNRRLER